MTNMKCLTKQDIEKLPNYRIIDVRTSEEREEIYIQESLHIPIVELAEKLTQLDKQIHYITACGKGGGRSIDGAQLLVDNGFKANWLCGGTIGYEKNK